MQVILREDVAHLGQSGQVVEARPGFVRNYLIPRGLAVAATGCGLRQLDHEKRVIATREQKLQRDGMALKSKLEALTINIARQVGKQAGQEEKLFGSVSNADIATALASKGVTVDRKKIQVAEAIRTLGLHSVTVQLGKGLTAALKVWVVAAE
ncbi:MAG: 50S ribosomal protein L9 [Proteobacteria bacterium]|nr:50S ribosomal protein L9 [Pseudomonadota bacterium]